MKARKNWLFACAPHGILAVSPAAEVAVAPDSANKNLVHSLLAHDEQKEKHRRNQRTAQQAEEVFGSHGLDVVRVGLCTAAFSWLLCSYEVHRQPLQQAGNAFALHSSNDLERLVIVSRDACSNKYRFHFLFR